MTFTKLFSSITESTVWSEPDETRLVWITMLAMADKYGRVWASIPGLANRARVSISATEEAVSKFLNPDKYSRTKDFEGKRIEPIDGGWRLLNFAKYRAIRDEEAIKESKRAYINNRRRVERGVENVEPVEQGVDRCRPNAEAEAEADPFSTTLSGKPDVVRPEDAKSLLICLNEASGSHYRPVPSNLSLIAARLAEPGVDLPGVKLMITRQCSLWLNTDMEKFLRPETLFAKSKFDSYYGNRTKPAQINSRSSQIGPDRNQGTFHNPTDYQAGINRRLNKDRQLLDPKMDRPPTVAPGNLPPV